MASSTSRAQTKTKKEKSKKDIMDMDDPIQVLAVHMSDVNSCDFGPRDRLVSASSDHMVRIWKLDANSKQYLEDPRSPLKHHTYAVNDVRFSPQGTMLATGSTDGSTVVWDLATGTPLCTFVQPSRLGVRVCRFSPDASMLVTAGDDDSACIWSLADRSLLRKFQETEHTVFAAEFTPDGNHLLTGDANGDLRLWDVGSSHNKSLVCLEEAHDLGALCCEFAPWTDEDQESLEQKFTLATGGNDDCVKLWTVVVGFNQKILSKKKLDGYHSGQVMCVRFSKDGRHLASSGGDKLVCIFNVETGSVYKKISYHERYVGSCAFSPSGGFFATGSNDKTVAIWPWESYDNLTSNSSTEANCLDENVNRLSVLAGREDALRLQSVPKAHGSDINDAVFVKDKEVVTCSSDKTVKVWSNVDQVQSAPEGRVLTQLGYAIYSLDYCPYRDLLANASMEGHVTLWNATGWKKITTLTPPGKAAIRTCRFSPDGRLIVIAGDDDMAHMFDLDTYQYVKGFKGHDATIFFACFTHDTNILLTGCNDGLIYAWEVQGNSKKPLLIVDDVHDLGVSCGDCKPDFDKSTDHSIVITGGNDSLLKVWKVAKEGSGKLKSIDHIKTLTGHGSSIMSVKFAKNAAFFASTSGDKTCRIWDSNTFSSLRVIEGHERYVNCVAISPSNELLVTGSNDRSFNVWKLSGPLVTGSAQRSTLDTGRVHEWSKSEVKNFLADCGIQSTKAATMTGPTLADMTYKQMLTTFGLSESDARRLMQKRSALMNTGSSKSMVDVPDEFVCPITQDVMKFPVLCNDGFIYEKAAIKEWLITRKKTSPMTNLPMDGDGMELQIDLQARIKAFMTK